MDFLSIFLVIVILFHPVYSESENNFVTFLDASNFDQYLHDNDLCIITFYAPWCGISRNLAPEFEKAAIELKNEQVSFANFDCDDENNIDTCRTYDIVAYPTIFIFRKDEPYERYLGQHTQFDIVFELNKSLVPIYYNITSSEDFTNLKKTDDLVLLGSFEKFEGEAYDNFVTVASLHNNYKFGITNALSSVLSDEYTVGPNKIIIPPGDSILLLKPFDEKHTFYTGLMTEQNILSFIKTNSIPLFGELNGATYASYRQQGLPIFYFFIDPSEKAITDTITTTARTAAVEFRDKLSFVYVDAIKLDKLMEDFGIQTPPGGGISSPNEKKYKYIGDIEAIDDIRRFIQDYLDDKVEPFLKSQEPPNDNSDPVTIVVGKEFEKIVRDETKDVLLELYVPSCCKEFAVIYKKVGKKFRRDDNIVIGKCDVSENDIPVTMNGLPTIIFYPANNKEGIQYTGEKTARLIKKFINDNRVSEKAVAKTHNEL